MKKFFLILLLCSKVISQETVELDLAEPTDVETLLEAETTAPEPIEAVAEPADTTAPEPTEAIAEPA